MSFSGSSLHMSSRIGLISIRVKWSACQRFRFSSIGSNMFGCSWVSLNSMGLNSCGCGWSCLISPRLNSYAYSWIGLSLTGQGWSGLSSPGSSSCTRPLTAPVAESEFPDNVSSSFSANIIVALSTTHNRSRLFLQCTGTWEFMILLVGRISISSTPRRERNLEKTSKIFLVRLKKKKFLSPSRFFDIFIKEKLKKKKSFV